MHLQIRKIAIYVTSGQPLMFSYWTENSGRDRILRVLTVEIIVSLIAEIKQEEQQREQVSQSISNPS